MPDGFDGLPPILQVAATLAVFIVGGGIAFFNFSSKWLGKFAPPAAKAAQPAATTDAVVVSAAFADGKPLRELNVLIAELNTVVGSLRTCVRAQTEEQVASTEAARRVASQVGRVGDLLEERLPHASRGEH